MTDIHSYMRESNNRASESVLLYASSNPCSVAKDTHYQLTILLILLPQG